MQKVPYIVHCEWWAPEGIERFSCEKRPGTLTWSGENPSQLEIIYPYNNFLCRHIYHHYDVIWGKDASGVEYTLFEVDMTDSIYSGNINTNKFQIGYIIIGAHIISPNKHLFEKSTIEFPFLKNWAYNKFIVASETRDYINLSVPKTQLVTLLDCKYSDEFEIALTGQYQMHFTLHKAEIDISTYLNLYSNTPKSIKEFWAMINEFSWFLSVVLYKKQFPCKISFYSNNRGKEIVMLFTHRNSENPSFCQLVKFDDFKHKIPSMLQNWHQNYVSMIPIVKCLLASVNRKSHFEANDFLTLAHSLDGYFKRFLNKKDGKDTRKYKDEIKKILKRFENVEVINKCKINIDELADSRDAYTHLIPNDDKKLKNVLSGSDLFWLSKKCQVLLTCCILDILGLTSEEINNCCNTSPISNLMNEIIHNSEF